MVSTRWSVSFLPTLRLQSKSQHETHLLRVLESLDVVALASVSGRSVGEEDMV